MTVIPNTYNSHKHKMFQIKRPNQPIYLLPEQQHQGNQTENSSFCLPPHRKRQDGNDLLSCLLELIRGVSICSQSSETDVTQDYLLRHKAHHHPLCPVRAHVVHVNSGDCLLLFQGPDSIYRTSNFILTGSFMTDH
ncbi:hypothetical protein CRENBAI_025656 [Crenichthys baileyi]|uniref:Uncharacterized protein n=1 Tax=Crenichthys baileyi TaxID=28760 RepID=A0AAV9SK10_9TELE